MDGHCIRRRNSRSRSQQQGFLSPDFDDVCAVSLGVHTAEAWLDFMVLEENDNLHVTAGVPSKADKAALITLDTRSHTWTSLKRLSGYRLVLLCEAGQVIHPDVENCCEEADAIRSAKRSRR